MEPDTPDPGPPPPATGTPISDAPGPPRGDHVDEERRAVAAEFTTFYRQAAPKLVGVLIRKGANADEAAEAAQEALTRAARSWSRIRTNPMSWCITTAERYHWNRKYSAEFSYDDIPPESPLLADPISDVFTRIVARLRLENAAAKVATLTPRQYDVLNLHLAGLTTSEIADHLGIAEPTVRVHLTHIRRVLDEPSPTDRPETRDR